jgi:hypothetical protein
MITPASYMKKYWFAVALILAQPITHAEEKSDPLDTFRVQTQFQTLMCRMETHAAILQVQLGKLDDAVPAMRICIKKAKAELKNIYPAALKAVAKKPAAAKLLKDYYASSLTALEGVAPNTSETKQGYAVRQDAADAKNREVWNRFEIEAGIQD